MLSASVDMLEHLGHVHHAKLIQDAIYKTIAVDKIHTPGIYAIFMCINKIDICFKPKK